MSHSPQQPLVSVGIPAYNRPKSLRHTLDCITRQTYRNLEILVSDNASPTGEVEAVVRGFMTADPRVRYYRQEQNRGMVPNYQFVLSQAAGEFFMWAADDDEWDERFVAHCVSKIGDATSYMPGYRFFFTHTGKFTAPPPVKLPPGFPRREAMRLFFKHWYVHTLYALHRRDSIRFVLSDPAMFNYDTYFALRILLEGRVVIDPTECLLTIRVETPEYVPKDTALPQMRMVGYRNTLLMAAQLILKADGLPVLQKLGHIWTWSLGILIAVLHDTKQTHPLLASTGFLFVRAASIPEKLRRFLAPSGEGS